MKCKRRYCKEMGTLLVAGLTLNSDGVYFIGFGTLCLCLKGLS
jgi:hypothetical protein